MKKLITIILISFIGLGVKAEDSCKVVSVKQYYFQWSYWTSKRSGWGENHIKLSKKPTKKYILEKYVYPIDNDFRKYKIEVYIEEVTDTQLSDKLQRDGLERMPDNIKSHYNLQNK